LWSTKYDATLGLSATPERGDDGLDDILIPAIGPVVYRYPLRAALDDHVLAALAVADLYIDLSELELGEYLEIERKIALLLSQGIGPGDSRVKVLRSTQESVSRRSGGRMVALRSLVEGGLLTDRRTLIFHEMIDQASATAQILEDSGVRYALEHSKLSADVRGLALRRFGTGAVETLVTVRALDEGIDVPDADMAVVVSGSMNARQRIQRAGRIVRPSGRGALLVSLLARGTNEELLVGARDAELFGLSRVSHFAGWDTNQAGPLVKYLHSLSGLG
jgi:superfamily II DNA or RNA helicase